MISSYFRSVIRIIPIISSESSDCRVRPCRSWDGEIYINGELLEESYGREVMQDAGLAAEPITLGDDEYFVLGDNRNTAQTAVTQAWR